MGARVVLTESDITRTLTRIAHEIIEASPHAEHIVLLGIPTRGSVLAERLGGIIRSITDADISVGSLDITLYRDDLTTGGHRTPSPTRVPEGGIDEKLVVLVDDVLFSGRTIRAALDAVTALGRPSAVRLAVLVDRGHRELPIRADHVGKNLPTHLGERISVKVAEVDGVDEVQVVS